MRTGELGSSWGRHPMAMSSAQSTRVKNASAAGVSTSWSLATGDEAQLGVEFDVGLNAVHQFLAVADEGALVGERIGNVELVAYLVNERSECLELDFVDPAVLLQHASFDELYFCKAYSCSMSATDVDEHVSGELLGRLDELVDLRTPVISLFVDKVVIKRSQPGAPRKVDLGRVGIEGPGWSN